MSYETYIDPDRLTAIPHGTVAPLVQLDGMITAYVTNLEHRHYGREIIRMIAEGLNSAAVRANHGPNSAELATTYYLDGVQAPEYPGYVPFRDYVDPADEDPVE